MGWDDSESDEEWETPQLVEHKQAETWSDDESEAASIAERKKEAEAAALKNKEIAERPKAKTPLEIKIEEREKREQQDAERKAAIRQQIGHSTQVDPSLTGAAAEKARLKLLSEAADLDSAIDAFGITEDAIVAPPASATATATSAPKPKTTAPPPPSREPPAAAARPEARPDRGAIEDFKPTSTKDFEVLASMIGDKLKQYAGKPGHMVLLKALMRGACEKMSGDDAKELSSFVSVLSNERLRADREKDKGAKKGKKGKLKIAAGKAVDDDDYGDFGGGASHDAEHTDTNLLQSLPDALRADLQAASDHFHAKRYADAAQAYRSLLERAPSPHSPSLSSLSPDNHSSEPTLTGLAVGLVHGGLGRVLQCMGDSTGAEMHFKLMARDADGVRWRVLLARLYEGTGRTKSAVKELRAIENDETEPPLTRAKVKYHIGTALLRLYKLNEAEAAFNEALALGVKPGGCVDDDFRAEPEVSSAGCRGDAPRSRARWPSLAAITYRKRAAIHMDRHDWQRANHDLVRSVDALVHGANASDCFLGHYRVVEDWDAFTVPGIESALMPGFEVHSLPYTKLLQLASRMETLLTAARGVLPRPEVDHARVTSYEDRHTGTMHVDADQGSKPSRMVKLVTIKHAVLEDSPVSPIRVEDARCAFILGEKTASAPVHSDGATGLRDSCEAGAAGVKALRATRLIAIDEAFAVLPLQPNPSADPVPDSESVDYYTTRTQLGSHLAVLLAAISERSVLPVKLFGQLVKQAHDKLMPDTAVRLIVHEALLPTVELLRAALKPAKPHARSESSLSLSARAHQLLEPSRLIIYRPSEGVRYEVGKLHILDMRPPLVETEGEVTPNLMSLWHTRQRWRLLSEPLYHLAAPLRAPLLLQRSLLLRAAGVPPSSEPFGRPRILYYSRSSASRRRMLDERILVSALRGRFGSPRIDYYYGHAAHSLVETIRLFRHADVLIGPRGSGLANMLFLPQSALVYMLPTMDGAPRRSHLDTASHFAEVDTLYTQLAAALGLKLHLLFPQTDLARPWGDYSMTESRARWVVQKVEQGLRLNNLFPMQNTTAEEIAELERRVAAESSQQARAGDASDARSLRMVNRYLLHRWKRSEEAPPPSRMLAKGTPPPPPTRPPPVPPAVGVGGDVETPSAEGVGGDIETCEDLRSEIRSLKQQIAELKGIPFDDGAGEAPPPN